MARRVTELLAAAGITAGIVNPRFIVPLDTALLGAHAQSARIIVTLENGVISGGFGSAVGETLADLRFPGTCLRIGWPDQFIPQGSPDILCERFGLTASAISEKILKAIKPG
jgi:1-deoxy-D-xylulose-5-phosphate synthase